LLHIDTILVIEVPNTNLNSDRH